MTDENREYGGFGKLGHHVEGYKFLRTVRGSRPYFEKGKSDLFAVIRQQGTATLFCSFSSPKTQWLNHLKILEELVDHKK